MNFMDNVLLLFQFHSMVFTANTLYATLNTLPKISNFLNSIQNLLNWFERTPAILLNTSRFRAHQTNVLNICYGAV